MRTQPCSVCRVYAIQQWGLCSFQEVSLYTGRDGRRACLERANKSGVLIQQPGAYCDTKVRDLHYVGYDHLYA